MACQQWQDLPSEATDSTQRARYTRLNHESFRVTRPTATAGPITNQKGGPTFWCDPLIHTAFLAAMFKVIFCIL
jgi:hypothetical protein